MRIDLHNHTTLCNHAQGSVEDYVKAAINAGIDVFGFSDHAPMDFDPDYRMHFEQMAHYKEAVLHVKERYKDRIEILFAYEVDYLPGHMDSRVLEADVDYLIGSVHFIDEWGFDNPEFIGRYEHENIDVIWQRYFDLIEAMAKSRLFDIVGHLDLIKVFKYLPTAPIETFAHKALDAIKAADMSLEINVSGYRKPIAEAYPSAALLRMAFERNIPITFGSDAHAPEQVGMFRNEAEAFARAVGYTHAALYRNRKRELVKF
jgi:histidinol-phosphatase (PHP family)